MKRVGKDPLFFILNISIPLVVGAILYLLFRPDAYICALIFRLFGTAPPVRIDQDNAFVCFVSYYLCDMLWAYSLAFVAYRIISDDTQRDLPTLLISIVFTVLTESFQYFGILPGTFDGFDILAEGLSIVSALGIIKLFYRRKKYEESN